VGSRFWPISTPKRPKQLLPLATERPLIVDTIERARALAPDERIRVLAPAALADALADAVPSLPRESFWSEPTPRGTAPALTWAAWRIQREDPGAVMVSLHADHVIRPLEAFERLIGEAGRLARSERLLLTVGALPDRPEVGFGYVQPGERLAAAEGFSAFRVARFHEKPDGATARDYVSRGYLWNTGLFVWPADLFLEEVMRHAPELGGRLGLLEGEGPEAFFDGAPELSVDVAVLERSVRVGVLEATFQWDDVGSWEALARTLPPDPAGNVSHGEAHVVEGSGNVVFTEDAPVVLFGVDDLVVVRTANATLIASRSRAPHLKALLDQLPDALRRLDP
jgi:mannose-1-phosphate guanylyltransferase